MMDATKKMIGEKNPQPEKPQPQPKEKQQPQRVSIVLRSQRSMGGAVREPGFVLLEAIAPEAITAQDIDKAIISGSVQVVPAKAAAIDTWDSK